MRTFGDGGFTMSNYKSVSALAEDFASSRQWVYKILREMEGLQRYKGGKSQTE